MAAESIKVMWPAAWSGSAHIRLHRLFDLADTPGEVDGLIFSTPETAAPEWVWWENVKWVACAATTSPVLPKGLNCRVITLAGVAELNQVTPVVDYTWHLILTLMHPAPSVYTEAPQGNWDRFKWPRPSMLSRKRLLVVGAGRIGQHVAQVGYAFGMHVTTTDALMCHALPDADIITLHTPPGIGTIIDRRHFHHMKQGVILINTAQGNAIDCYELLHALELGTVAKAALDCLPGEFEPDFDPRKNPLIPFAEKHPDRLLISPHIAGSSEDAWEITQNLLIDKIIKELNL